MFALDTDTVSLLGHGNARVRARVAACGPDGVGVTVVTRAEVLRGRFDALTKAADGAEWLAAARRLADDEARLRALIVLPVTPAAAARLDEFTRRRLLRRRRSDLLIACIALAHAATLVTRNAKDFQAVPGLNLANWAD